MRRTVVVSLLALPLLFACSAQTDADGSNDPNPQDNTDDGVYYVEVTTPSGPVDCVAIRTVKGAGITCDWSKE